MCKYVLLGKFHLFSEVLLGLLLICLFFVYLSHRVEHSLNSVLEGLTF